MAIFQAFRALRPVPDKAEAVAALPYDVVTREEAKEIGDQNPDSFLHVDRAEMDLPADTDLYDQKVYDRARENLINMETDSFYCSGQVQVADATIRCSNTAGHGAQTFTQALTNSCNPAFIEIGQRIGIDKFSYYFEGFGLAEKTGIDLPGEAVSYSVTGDDMTIVDLASAAYGQCNKVTAMELVTAYSAAINGGYMVTPHVVDHVVDSNGNIVLQNETEVKRQIVSEETSDIVREQLEAVVNNNPLITPTFRATASAVSPVLRKSWTLPRQTTASMWHPTAALRRQMIRRSLC